MSEERKIILTTGGSGGHIIPAIVMANKLKENGFDVKVVGDEQLKKYKNSLETSYEIIPTGKNKSIKSIFNIIKGIVKSFKILKKEKPKYVMGFGSYASFPILLSAKLLKISIILHEQNSHLGKVNKWFSNHADVIFTSFPELYGLNIENAHKIKCAGNPLRENIKKLYNQEYRYPDFNKGEKFNIFVYAGSGGASFFGNKFLETFEKLNSETKKKIKVIEQVRENDLIKTKEFFNKNNILNEVKTFFEDINEKFKVANLVICRSGSSMFELFVAGLPVIFIPSPNVANNHQFYNAEMIEKQNACLLVEEQNFNPNNFAILLESLMNNKEKLNELRENIKNLSTINSDEEILKIISNLFEEKDGK